MKSSKDRVEIDYDFGKNKRKAWLKILHALGEFLIQHSNPAEHVSIFAYESEKVGGLRIQEITWTVYREGGGMGAASYTRNDEGSEKFFAAVDHFLESFGDPVVRPFGWESCLNLHGEARIAILNAMGMETQAAEEYQIQLEFEKSVKADPDPRDTH